MATHPTGPRPNVPEIAPELALERQRRGAVIVDVREPDEWQAGHVAGARHIPLGELPNRLGELDRGGEIIAVCRSGNRSAFATDILRRAGFANASNLTGGTLAWMERGLPTSGEPPGR